MEAKKLSSAEAVPDPVSNGSPTSNGLVASNGSSPVAVVSRTVSCGGCS